MSLHLSKYCIVGNHVAAQITIYGTWHDILVLHITHARKPPLTHDLLVSFADNLGKEIEPRVRPVKRSGLIWIHLFDTLIVYRKEFF